MSLLMDALRRAEAEKKEAAKNRLASNSSDPDIQDISEDDEDLGATIKLDRLPLPMAAAEHTEDKTPSVEDITSSIADSLNDLSIDFESTSPRMHGDEVTSQELTSPAHKDVPSVSDNPQGKVPDEPYDFSIHAESQDGRTSEPLALEPLHDAEITNSEPLPDPITSTNTTLSSASKLDSDAGTTRDNESTRAASDVDPLLISMPGESTLETSSGQTAVSANTVFEAGSPGISRRIILWTLTLGVALFGLLAVTGAYYFQQAPTARNLPSPIVSVELEKARLKETFSTAQADPVTGPQSSGSVMKSTAGEVGVASTNAEIETIGANTPAKSKPKPGDSPQPRITPAVALESQVTPIDNSPSGGVSADELAPRSSVTPTTPRSPTVNTKRLRIARSLRGVRSNEQVMAAYKAYKAGDLKAAKVLYEKALSIRPQDVNALNGLAALALGENNSERAHQLYSRALKLDPNNPTATAAIFQIEGGVGTRVTETQLKMMLDNDGDRGLINFALGNLYSSHGRWNDAQLAFFEAVRHRPNNADYLFNLAVSLDQIGQRKPALDYYQQALTAADNSSAGFNAADAIARIQTITKSASSNAP